MAEELIQPGTQGKLSGGNDFWVSIQRNDGSGDQVGREKKVALGGVSITGDHPAVSQ